MPSRPASAPSLLADPASVQKRRQDQYAGTCKRAFEKAYAQKQPTTAAEWGSLYVSVSSILVAQMRKRHGTGELPLPVGERTSFRIGYGLFFTHEVSENGLVAKQRAAASAAYSHEDEGRAWKEFCKRTNRDDRPEAEQAAHARAVATLRAEARARTPSTPSSAEQWR